MKVGIVLLALWPLALWNQDKPKQVQPSTSLKIKKEALKPTLEKLGYEPRELGNGVFEIQVEKGDETAFIAVSLSASLAKLWLTSNYGLLTAKESADPEYLLRLLQKNGEIQPAHFYVRKGKLNLGVSVDNRIATPQLLAREIQSFADTVLKTKEFWTRRE